jgi:signal transduction histidine kinase
MTTPSKFIRVRAKHVPWLVISLILLIMAATVAIITMNLRRGLRTQIIQQDGLMLYAASMVPTSIEDDILADLAEDPDLILVTLQAKVLNASDQKDVIDLRIFDQNGKVVFGSRPRTSLGEDERPLTQKELDRLRTFETISSYESSARVKLPDSAEVLTPLVRALVPLQRTNSFIGAAEFIMDGRVVQAELERLDQNLWKYSIRIFLIGSGVMALSLWWAFRQLQSANRALEERTKSLLRANHELTLAAKTSAVGAITAHLIHDLKSPLFGLQSFVSARGTADEEDWEIALDTTHRMQRLIQQIVKLLQEEKTTEHYELSVNELLSLCREKLKAECETAGIHFAAQGSAIGSLINRDGNIILLLITNLVHNAIQATPKGGVITVRVSNEDGNALFEVRDTGPGLPEHILSTLFTPSRSTKDGGTGLGLAISKQLANHIGADLSLKETSKSGTVFQLRVPERMLNPELVAS